MWQSPPRIYDTLFPQAENSLREGTQNAILLHLQSGFRIMNPISVQEAHGVTPALETVSLGSHDSPCQGTLTARTATLVNPSASGHRTIAIASLCSD